MSPPPVTPLHHQLTTFILIISTGKTTAVKKLVDFLQSHGKRCQGFYTDEVRENGERIGFDVITVPDGKRGILARKSPKFKSQFKTGRYFVDVESFEKLAIPSLTVLPEGDNPQETIFVLDEIGRMELHSTVFAEHVRNMMASTTGTNFHLVGAITAPRYGHRVPFCDQVTATSGVEVHNLTKKTRDDVVEGLLRSIKDRWLQQS